MASQDRPAAAVGWKIRNFQPADVEAILGILRDAAEAAQWPSDSYAKLAATKSGVVLVCKSGVQGIGFLAARQPADEAEILNIAVHRDFRRRGVASALLVAALDRFRSSAIRRVFLELRASNLAARALYDSHGFVPSGLRKAYYRDPTEDALCMHKELTRSAT
jgi:[ribosomal protein S18]-alanine N-acetyltransferase